MRIAELECRMAERGAGPVHRRRLLAAWLRGEPLERADRPSQPFPAALRTALPEVERELAEVARVVARHPSSDGSQRRLHALDGGATCESVLLPREGLCVSTQVGCAVGCRFCKTGESGLLRQLSDAEIAAQVALARRERAVRRVVLMGMGEPAHNLEAVLGALAALGGPGGLPHKGLVVSTVGERRLLEALLAHEVRPALALSLHTLDAALRAELLPRAPRIDPAELLELALAYSDAVTWPLQVQWTLLEGVNDGDGEVAALVARLRGRRAIVNFIPWNPVAGQAWSRPGWPRAVAMVRALKAQGVRATLRRSAGADVEGACGQLAGRRGAPAAAHQA